MIDTSGTFIAGYVVATIVYAAYVVSLWRRSRAVARKLERRAK